MKNFSIYKKSSNLIEVVKRGWSFPAFFFGIIWCFYKKLYSIGIMIFIFSILINYLYINHNQFHIISYILNVCTAGFLGTSGNKLIEYQLENNGYILKEIITAKDKFNAINLFLNKAEK